ncbi:hypothetical protein T4B_14680 [Trichinella pseudospiralis]|uniref:Uncharacterized protein n=1 Tax=Trichinella pseudospiralis TaxID=6337 RepID=A0A0V1IBW5_TRIPS|nr:hypothetical protein T4B_14680 [Trichinella pseudospiralis]KRZ42986.1 hypothetical protein T4C_1912 [Trichinella pseudospiralis]
MHLWPQLQQQHNICLMLSIKAYAYFVCSEYTELERKNRFSTKLQNFCCSWGINSTLKLKWKFLNQIYPMAIKIDHLLISVGVEVLQFRKKVSGCVSYCVDRSSSDQQ